MHCTCVCVCVCVSVCVDVSVNVVEGPIGVFNEEAYTYGSMPCGGDFALVTMHI